MNSHIQSVLTRVSQHYGITVAELLARDRSKSVNEARQVAMWICRHRFRMSYPELGRAFGRDHTTCMSAVRRMDRADGLVLLSRLSLFGDVVKATPQLDNPPHIAAAE